MLRHHKTIRSALWIHGHMHDPFNYEIYGTRVVCILRGYAPKVLAPEFRPFFLSKKFVGYSTLGALGSMGIAKSSPPIYDFKK